MKVASGKLHTRVFGALVVASAFGIVSVSGAAAKTVTVGQLFTPTTGCGAATFLQTAVASGTSYTVPKAGVITSWSFEDGASTLSGLKLKVASSAGGSNYTIVAEATAGAQTSNTVNTYPTHIPVTAGNLIGIYQGGGHCSTFTGNPSNIIATDFGVDVPPGPPATFSSASGVKFPVSVKLALDCTVPKLKGKALAVAKDALADASCRLGEVLPEGQTTGTVTRQKLAAGKVLAPGAKVNVQLG